MIAPEDGRLFGSICRALYLKLSGPGKAKDPLPAALLEALGIRSVPGAFSSAHLGQKCLSALAPVR